jgi:hypothetical protein
MAQEKARFFLAALITLILLMSGFYLLQKSFPQIPSEAQTLSKQCSGTDRETCLTLAILKITDQDPQKLIPLFADFSTLLKEGTLTDDPRIFSPLVHEVGMELAFRQIPPEEAFALCPKNFKAGCLHGVVMEYLDLLPGKTFEDFISFCDFSKNDGSNYRNCIHGIGHELTAKNSGALQELLELCPNVDHSIEHACTTGILMEYSTGVSGTGEHTHDQPTGSIILPCEEVSENYKSTCYVSLSSYRQYLASTEGFSQTAATCLSVPTNYQSACFLGLAEKIMTASAENLSKAQLLCEELPTAAQDLCLKNLESIKKIESVL